MKTISEKRAEDAWKKERMQTMTEQQPYSKKDDLLLMEVLRILAEDWLERNE